MVGGCHIGQCISIAILFLLQEELVRDQHNHQLMVLSVFYCRFENATCRKGILDRPGTEQEKNSLEISCDGAL